ncbi:crossover junction endodeoxyribonuclease RuvC [Candidatus Woesebacteria bacterium]|nr:MAG: crossover junction endodeoxyribonuclease RuvC [Candidatus Woesebacteria bacterium]
MLILGIDPGTATTGYGFLNIHKLPKEGEKLNGHYTAGDFGLIETTMLNTPGERLYFIHNELRKIIEKHKPHVMAIEKVFFATNRKTAIRVGQAQGVMLMAAAHFSIAVVEYSPMTIKKIVAGNGRADKKQVQKSVRDYLGNSIKSKPKKKTHFDNEADALAVALCHAMSLTELQED